MRIRAVPVFALALALITAVCRADELSGVVQDAKGNPVPGVAVSLEVGRARYSLTPAFDEWYAVQSKSGTTGDDGRFAFSDLTEGAVSTAFVNTGTAVGVAHGSGELTVRLGKPGAVRGKVTGKRQDLKGVRVFARGGMGLGFVESTVDKKTGTYTVAGVAPGEGRVSVLLNNFKIASQNLKIEGGTTAKAKTVKYKGKFAAGPDPLVECLKVKLVDGDSNPVHAVQLLWSSRWMDGGMNSDEQGMVKLAGGGVGIGGPPYFLRLTSLKGGQGMYGGVLKKVRKGIAIVEIHALHGVKGRVLREETPVEHYRLFIVGPGETPRVYWANVADGEYTAHLPAGTCRFIVGTADARLHTHEYEVVPSAQPQPHEIRLK